MPNDNVLKGMACPKCASEGPFDIDCTATFTVWDDGTDLEYSALDWEPASCCTCKSCGHEADVYDFTIENQSAS